jgi:hypothetical protein
MIYILSEHTVPRIEQLDHVVIAAFELLVLGGFLQIVMS